MPEQIENENNPEAKDFTPPATPEGGENPIVENSEHSLASSAELSKSEGKKKRDIKLIPTHLFEYLAELYGDRNFNKAYKAAFSKLGPESRLSFDQRQELLELGMSGDKDNRLLLSLAEFLLESNGSQVLRDSLMTFIEYVVSHEGNLSKTQQTSVFQVWMDKCGSSNKAAFLFDQINHIKDGLDKQGKAKPLSEARKNSLKCIGAIWLFYKEHAPSEQLIKELSRDTFGLDGAAPASVERRALGFAARMVSSTNREGFAFFINHLSRQQSLLSSELRAVRERADHAELRSSAQAEKVASLGESLAKRDQQISQLQQRIAELEVSLEESHERASHQGIHQRDELKVLRGKVANFLEQHVLTELRSAQTANSRNPPKTRIVEIKLDDVLQQIEDQILWLKQ